MDAIELSIPLEKNFNRNDEYKGRRAELVDEVVEINIGTHVSPKMVNIGKNASPKERNEIETLIREYKGIFAWMYSDLKTYDPPIIEHTIPLK